MIDTLDEERNLSGNPFLSLPTNSEQEERKRFVIGHGLFPLNFLSSY
jgi:hypothetical protein